jgi:hypothetical protein
MKRKVRANSVDIGRIENASNATVRSMLFSKSGECLTATSALEWPTWPPNSHSPRPIRGR